MGQMGACIVNYLLTIQEVNGVPLSYIVRENEESEVERMKRAKLTGNSKASANDLSHAQCYLVLYSKPTLGKSTNC